ncbi:4-hydroxy-tetrahydrodipicolinate synthase [Lacibacter cauensis]|uniref:4-hydroxy-tetrahydrodipicolinate synthase n=1 Tax=Lacibacter cauensis TaxID=510947 RepID=A0A562SCQ4_9BACT|nr:4-hydroxy-tetrahydrodipicolinate synthase [Lacibacter cauensis]TWI79121.1 4-hydroxy-tetrahydrodipicolinate synthase [Lacibacter cauensis]
MNYRELLRGTGVALVTPFKQNMEIDFPALERVINYVIENGAEYVVTLGTTGETPTLSKDEKIELILFTYNIVADRVPVVVGIGGNNTLSLIKDLETFPLHKAAAVLSASPYYNKPSQEGIYQHYKALAEVSPKPIILYNVPGRTGRNMSAQTTLRLAHDFKNIIGIKEASGDLTQAMQILKDKPADFLVLSGDDNLALPQMACGMDGIISVIANCMPKQFAEMVRLSLQNNFAAAKLLNDQMLEAYDLLFAENNPAGVKAFLAELGLIDNHLRLPVVPLSEGLHQSVVNYLQRIK